MAAKYLIATGNWSSDLIWSTTDGGANDTTHPVDGDAVSCTAASGAVTLTVDVSSAATSIVFTGFVGTFTGSAALQLKGNLTAVAGMTYSYTGTITEALTAGTATLTSAGKTLCGALTMNGAGGTVTFGDAFVTTGTCTLTAGTWNDGNVNLTMDAWSCTGTTTRNTVYGTTNTWFVTGSGSCWTLTGSGYTSNAGTRNTSVGQVAATVNFSYSGGLSRTMTSTHEHDAYGLPTLKVSAGNGTFTAYGGGPANSMSFACGHLDFTGFSGTFVHTNAGAAFACGALAGNLTLGAGMTISNPTGETLLLYPKGQFTGLDCVITSNGVAIPKLSIVTAYNSTSTASLADDLLVTGSFASWEFGAYGMFFDAANHNVTCATFSSTYQDPYTRTITMGSGTWTLTSTAATTVFDLSVTTGLTLNPGTATIALTGVTANTRTITANSVQLPSIAVNAGSGPVTFTNVNCDSLTFGNSYSGTIANQTITIRGNVQLSNHASFALTAGANAWTLAATSTGKTFASQGKTIDFPLTFNGSGGGWTMQDALTHGITRTLTLTNGALSFGTGLTHTMGFLASSNANTRTIDSGTSTLQFPATGVLIDTSTSTNLTWAGTGTLKLTDSSGTARSITAGSKRLPSIWVSAGTSTTTLTDVTGCIDLNMTGMGAGTIAAGSAAFAIGGNTTFIAAGTWSYTGNLTFDATATGKTITSAGKALTSGTVTFSGSGGGWTLQDAPETISGGLTVAVGHLNTNDFAVTTPSLVFSGSGVRELTLGASVVSLTGTGTVLDASGSNQTVNAGTSVVSQTDGTSTLKTLNLGNKNWATVRTKKSGTNRVAIAGGAGAMAFDLAA